MKTTALLFLSLAFWLSGCATSSAQRSDTPEGLAQKAVAVESEARRPFAEAERAYEGRRYEMAKTQYTQLRTRFPKGKAAMMANYRLGSIAYYEGDYSAASKEFEAFLVKYPNSELSFDVTYNLAACEYQQGRYERATQLLRTLRPDAVARQDGRRADVILQLTAQSAAATGDHPAAASAYLRQAQLPALDSSRRNAAFENFRYHTLRINDRSTLGELLAIAPEGPARTLLDERLAALESNSATASTNGDDRPAPTFGEESLRSSAGEKNSIGVVLPLTGKQAMMGRRALDGILLAAELFGGDSGREPRIFVEDSASDPATAAAAVDRLVTNRNVMAIIGPLGWKEALAVADKAQRLGVPNISLAARDGIAERGAFLFQNALTPRVQLENLVEHCIKNRGMHRFAIVAPSDAFGRELSNLFWDLVERQGGIVVGYEAYPAEAKDFQTPIRSIVGLGQPTWRRLEQSRLVAFMKKHKEQTKRDSKAVLPPIVDFDAIFVPDQPKAVAQLAASLNYFDVQNVPLLGTTEWNSGELLKRGGALLHGAMFPGSTAIGRGGRRQEFLRSYESAFGSSPDLLASQAYEAMELVMVAARESSSNRADLASKLASIRDFDSPLGTLSFDETRLAKRRLPVLSLGPNGAAIQQ